MEENKNVVKGVSEVVSAGVEKVSFFKKISKRLFGKFKKEIKDSKPRIEELKDETKEMLKKAEKQGQSMVDSAVQLKHDVEKGIKIGLDK